MPDRPDGLDRLIAGESAARPEGPQHRQSLSLGTVSADPRSPRGGGHAPRSALVRALGPLTLREEQSAAVGPQGEEDVEPPPSRAEATLGSSVLPAVKRLLESLRIGGTERVETFVPGERATRHGNRHAVATDDIRRRSPAGQGLRTDLGDSPARAHGRSRAVGRGTREASVARVFVVCSR